MVSEIVKVYATQRVASSHDPNVFYEFVHARVRPDRARQEEVPVVLIQMIRADRPNEPRPPEIHVSDLAEVEEALILFLDRARRKSGDTTSLHIPFLPMPSSEPHGRYAPGAPRRKPAGAPDEPVHVHATTGAKRASFGQPAPATPSAAPPAAPPPAPASQPDVPPPPAKTTEQEPYHLVPFTLNDPPETQALLDILDREMDRLVVVARSDLADRVRQYLDGAIRGGDREAPKAVGFSALVLPRPRGRLQLRSKMAKPLARALMQVVSDPTKVLWLPPGES